MKFSSKIEKCSLSPMRKFAALAEGAEERGLHIYRLNIGQPDLPTPEAFFESLRSFHQPVLSYSPSPGLPEYLDAVCGYYRGLGVELTRAEMLATTGGSEALQMAISAILDDGDEIAIPEPFYPNYATMTNLTGASVRPITTYPEEGYRYAFRDRVEASINERTRAIMITNPGNPTGCVISREELKLMLDIAKEHGLFIIVDEVYREFVYNGEALMSALQFPGYEENLIVIDSVSKRFSACGARVGVLISRNKELMSHCLKWSQMRLSSPTVDQMAAAALYSFDERYFDDMRREYMARRDTLIRGLRKIPGVVCDVPQGAFYVMAALPVDDAEDFQRWLLTDFDDQGDTLMFAAGGPFYATPGKGRNEVRMAYVLEREKLERAMEILAAAIRRYNAR